MSLKTAVGCLQRVNFNDEFSKDEVLSYAKIASGIDDLVSLDEEDLVMLTVLCQKIIKWFLMYQSFQKEGTGAESNQVYRKRIKNLTEQLLTSRAEKSELLGQFEEVCVECESLRQRAENLGREVVALRQRRGGGSSSRRGGMGATTGVRSTLRPGHLQQQASAGSIQGHSVPQGRSSSISRRPTSLAGNGGAGRDSFQAAVAALNAPSPAVGGGEATFDFPPVVEKEREEEGGGAVDERGPEASQGSLGPIEVEEDQVEVPVPSLANHRQNGAIVESRVSVTSNQSLLQKILGSNRRSVASVAPSEAEPKHSRRGTSLQASNQSSLNNTARRRTQNQSNVSTSRPGTARSTAFASHPASAVWEEAEDEVDGFSGTRRRGSRSRSRRRSSGSSFPDDRGPRRPAAAGGGSARSVGEASWESSRGLSPRAQRKHSVGSHPNGDEDEDDLYSVDDKPGGRYDSVSVLDNEETSRGGTWPKSARSLRRGGGGGGSGGCALCRGGAAEAKADLLRFEAERAAAAAAAAAALAAAAAAAAAGRARQEAEHRAAADELVGAAETERMRAAEAEQAALGRRRGRARREAEAQWYREQERRLARTKERRRRAKEGAARALLRDRGGMLAEEVAGLRLVLGEKRAAVDALTQDNFLVRDALARILADPEGTLDADYGIRVHRRAEACGAKVQPERSVTFGKHDLSKIKVGEFAVHLSNSAVSIQSAYRGHRERKRFNNKIMALLG